MVANFNAARPLTDQKLHGCIDMGFQVCVGCGRGVGWGEGEAAWVYSMMIYGLSSVCGVEVGGPGGRGAKHYQF